MFKFLRKYNKWILAVGGTLLMIVFLIPQAINQLSQRAALGSAVWATVGENGEEVPATDRRQCEQELEVLERLQRAGVPLGITDEPAHWYLLVREADQAGLLGGRVSDQIPAEQLQGLYTVVGRSRVAEDALSKSLAIGRMINMYQNAATLSDTRLRRRAARLFHAVDGRAVVLEASAEADVPDPAEAEIAAQFERFKDIDPVAITDDNPAGFGYRLPDRFKIEWLSITTDSVREMVEASGAISNVALFKHWQRNAQEKGFPPADPTQPVPDAVREDLAAELTETRRNEIERFVNDQLITSVRRLDSEEGYYVLPADWVEQRVDLAALAQQLETEFPGLPLPTYQGIGDRWLTTDDLVELDELGRAVTDKFGRGQTDIATLVAATREFGGDLAFVVQEGVAGPPLRDRLDQSLLFFRVTDTDPARPPHDVDEVRDAVVSDLRRQADFERLLARQSALEATARDEGLLALALDEGSELVMVRSASLYNTSFLDFQLQNNMRLAPIASSLPVIGQHEQTVGAIVDAALALPQDRPLSEIPAAERVLVLPVESTMAVMVVELTGQQPLDRERFARIAGSGALQAMILGEELTEVEPPIDDVFSYEALKTRHGFALQRRGGDDDDDPEAGEDATTAPANATAGG